MSDSTLQPIADAVTRRAKRQGYVTPREIRSELTLAGLPATRWKEVVALARPALDYRHGRYYHSAAVGSRVFQEQEQQRLIDKAIRKLVRQHRAAAKQRERRGQVRTDFIQPVKVLTEDGKTLSLLSRDVSTTGIRLIGTHQLLGHKVKVELPQADETPLTLSARVLWTCAVGDGLFENGGNFLSIETQTA